MAALDVHLRVGRHVWTALSADATTKPTPAQPNAVVIGIPVVLDKTMSPWLWRLERDGMTLRAGVIPPTTRSAP